MKKVKTYLILYSVILFILSIIGCQKFTIHDTGMMEYTWLCTVTIPGYDTIWPGENSDNIHSCQISREEKGYDNVFHYYVNNQLIGVQYFTEIYNDISGAGSTAINPHYFDVYYNKGEEGSGFRMLQWYFNISEDFNNKSLYAVLDFPHNYNTTMFSDTIHYAIFEYKFIRKK